MLVSQQIDDHKYLGTVALGGTKKTNMSSNVKVQRVWGKRGPDRFIF